MTLSDIIQTGIVSLIVAYALYRFIGLLWPKNAKANSASSGCGTSPCAQCRACEGFQQKAP